MSGSRTTTFFVSSSSRATCSAANTAVPPDPPDEDPLLPRDGPRREEGVAIGDLHVAIDHVGIERLGPEVLADALHEVGARLVAGVDGALGVGADDRDRRLRSLR